MRENVASEILKCYEFLSFFLIPPESIKRPPPGGWPNITSETLGFLGKNEDVVALFKILPYIDEDQWETVHIAAGCICNDYSGKWFERERQGNDTDEIEGYEDVRCASDCDLINQPPNAATATIARGDEKYGNYILCDTTFYSFAMICLMDSDGEYFDTAEELFTKLRMDFCSLKLFPSDVRDIRDLAFNRSNPEMEEFRAICRRNGWPNANYQKDECLKEIEQHARKIYGKQ